MEIWNITTPLLTSVSMETDLYNLDFCMGAGPATSAIKTEAKKTSVATQEASASTLNPSPS